jgi:hypothetical protein
MTSARVLLLRVGTSPDTIRNYYYPSRGYTIRRVGTALTQLKLVDIATQREQRLPEPKARPRDPWTAETMEEFRRLWLLKYGRNCRAQDELDFLETHSTCEDEESEHGWEDRR